MIKNKTNNRSSNYNKLAVHLITKLKNLKKAKLKNRNRFRNNSCY